MKKSSNNEKNNNILLSSPQIRRNLKIKNYTLTPHYNKNFFESSMNSVTGEMKQKILNSNKSKNLYKRYLFLKKIDLTDLANKYFIEGMKKIFNDKKLYLSEYYKDSRIVVGKSHYKSETNLLHSNENKQPNSPKRRTCFNRVKERFFGSNVESAKLFSKTKKNFYRKNDNSINDDDLKNIFQKWLEQEKSNNKNKIKKDLKFNKINDISKKEFNGILNLQNLILNKRKERNIETSKIEQRIQMHTAKHRDKLLINKISDYRIKKEEIDELENNNLEPDIKNKTSNNILTKTKNKKLKLKESNAFMDWLVSLRDYDTNNKNNKNNSSINILKTNQLNEMKKRCNSGNILNLKNKSSFYSFDKKEVLYNPGLKLNSIYARIIPNKYKQKEKIRDTLKDFKNISRNFLRNKQRNKLENNILHKTNIYEGLNVKGKSLLNFEIEISKDLEGKRKRIVKFPYLENETEEKTFFESFNINKNDIPQTVKNASELHYN